MGDTSAHTGLAGTCTFGSFYFRVNSDNSMTTTTRLGSNGQTSYNSVNTPYLEVSSCAVSYVSVLGNSADYFLQGRLEHRPEDRARTRSRQLKTARGIAFSEGGRRRVDEPIGRLADRHLIFICRQGLGTDDGRKKGRSKGGVHARVGHTSAGGSWSGKKGNDGVA